MTERNTDKLPGDWRWTCTIDPVQAHGHLADGRLGYFRARHCEWTFRASTSATNNMVDVLMESPAFSGPDPSDGRMTHAEALAIVMDCIERLGGA